MRFSIKTFSLPRQIRMDASTACQLRCPSCPTAAGDVKQTLGSGFLRFRDFRSIVDKNPWVSSIELSNWGEIFLNKELIPILRYAYRHNVILRAANGANLNTVSEEVLDALVRYRFERITCSIDGTSQETYSKYRRNGNFQNVIKNIRMINSFKRAYSSKYPILKWQFVAFGHNEHEINQARSMADELEMEFFLKLSWEDLYKETFSPIKDASLIKKETGLNVANRKEFREQYGKEYIGDCCLELWIEPQINYDGRLLGCCVNYWGDYGNVLKEGLAASLNNEKIKAARDMLMGRRPMTEEMPCARCKIFHSRMKNSDWVTDADIKNDYFKSSTYIMLENRILGSWLAQKLALSISRVHRRIQKGGLVSAWPKVGSGVYPLQIPLPFDQKKAWEPFSIFKGVTIGAQELSCHASTLIRGHCPHPPHKHKEEELLLVLSGEVDLILPEAADQWTNGRKRLKGGQFVYYPRNLAHTIETVGASPANYLMFKWFADFSENSNNDRLMFGCFDMFPPEDSSRKTDGFCSRRIFAGPTEYLNKLECHASTLNPQAGYDSHVDDYDVAIIILEGQVETLGQRVSPHNVIFYPAGMSHGIKNFGAGVAKYLVFEFHPQKTFFSPK